MDATHLHLMLNHLPLLGSFAGLALLAAGWLRNSDELKIAAFWFFAVGAVLAIPIYLTGEPAVKTVKYLPGVSLPSIERHEETAQLALVSTLALGLVSGAGLIRLGRGKSLPTWFMGLLAACALLASGLLIWTSGLGGQIRHSEIRAVP